LTLAGAGSVSCEKVPLLAPAGTVISLVSTTNVLPINGETDIIAVLIESGGTGDEDTGSAGTPVHNGTLVSFTSSLGKIEPLEARTNNGRVTVKLTADGRSGTATVTAYSGSARQTVEVVIGGAAAERVLVTANPTSLGSAGGSATITARVEDVSGNPLLGVPVAFTTTSGTLSAVSSVTNEAGLATSELSTTAAATVTATAGGKVGTADLTLRSASSVTLGVPAGALTVGAPVTFTVTPGAGSTLSNVVVDFGDGNSANLGTVSTASSVVNFYEDVEIFLVRVTATDPDGSPVTDSSSIAVGDFNISASASPSTVTLGTGVILTVTNVPANVPLETVEWRFGDKVDQTIRFTDSTSTPFTYPQRGNYTAEIIVRPKYGPSKTVYANITVT
jgi:adhesin/invasin